MKREDSSSQRPTDYRKIGALQRGKKDHYHVNELQQQVYKMIIVGQFGIGFPNKQWHTQKKMQGM